MFCTSKFRRMLAIGCGSTQKIEERRITLVERRPPWNASVASWLQEPFAQMRLQLNGEWGLFFMDSNLAWQR